MNNHESLMKHQLMILTVYERIFSSHYERRVGAEENGNVWKPDTRCLFSRVYDITESLLITNEICAHDVPKTHRTQD